MKPLTLMQELALQYNLDKTLAARKKLEARDKERARLMLQTIALQLASMPEDSKVSKDGQL